MSYYVKPSSDIFIKYLFGTEENKPILLAFINAVLSKTDFDLIVSVEILNPFNIKEFTGDKETVLDVKATDNNGRIYDIEVQAIGIVLIAITGERAVSFTYSDYLYKYP